MSQKKEAKEKEEARILGGTNCQLYFDKTRTA
jgi:hypothetical protein